MAATERLLSEGASYSELNVERIAKAAGISRTAFYFYFADKRDLLTRLAGDVADELYRQAEVFFAGDGPAEEQFREALRNVAALYREHGWLVRAIVEVSTYDEEVAVFWRGLLDRFIEATRRRIESERAKGSTGPDAHATAFALVWMIERSLYQQFVQGDPVDPDELMEAIVRLFSAAL